MSFLQGHSQQQPSQRIKPKKNVPWITRLNVPGREENLQMTGTILL